MLGPCRCLFDLFKVNVCLEPKGTGRTVFSSRSKMWFWNLPLVTCHPWQTSLTNFCCLCESRLLTHFIRQFPHDKVSCYTLNRIFVILATASYYSEDFRCLGRIVVDVFWEASVLSACEVMVKLSHPVNVSSKLLWEDTQLHCIID